MEEPKQEPGAEAPVEREALARRDFLASLGKWSAAVIGGVAMAGVFGLPGSAEAGGWVNRRGLGGGGWVNGGGGGGGWANARGGYGGGGWANRRGLGGGAWVNNR